MVDMPAIVVLVNKSLIRVAKIEGGELLDPIEMEWKPELLRRAFGVVKDRYKSTRIRLILDEDLSHTLNLEIPQTLDAAAERQAVSAKLSEQIPEVLTAGNWDYKVKEETATGKVVTVFVPVQESFIAISDAAAKEGLEIEAVEPISISLTRDPNPFIGMAKKTDLKGADDEVLNIQPVFAPTETANPVMTSNSLTSEPKKLNKIIIVVIAVILVSLLAYGIAKVVGTKSPKNLPSPTPSPVEMATPTPTPTPAPVDLKALKLEVLNGAGVPGQAGVVAKALSTAGFDTAKTGNAANYKYTDTIVSLKSTVPISVFQTIVTALSDNFSVKQGSPLDSDSDFDVVVTVGINSSLPSPTPKPSVTPTPKPSVSPSPSTSPSPAASSIVSPSPLPSHSPSPAPSA